MSVHPARGKELHRVTAPPSIHPLSVLSDQLWGLDLFSHTYTSRIMVVSKMVKVSCLLQPLCPWACHVNI